jgi:5-methylthioadenosine/S-adenosylhomocysteine deaminase
MNRKAEEHASRQSDRDLLVQGGDVLTPDGRLAQADVLIRKGFVVEVAPDVTANAPLLDATNSIVVPGLVNAHVHSGENYDPGRYENLPLDLWFVHSHEVTRTEPPTFEEIYVRTLLGALLMLRSGTTCAADFIYEAPEITVETLEPVVQAYVDAGLRATVVLGLSDKPFLDSLPLEPEERVGGPAEAAAPSCERILDLAREATARWHEAGGRIGIGLGPSAPQRCSDELLEESRALAVDRGLVWHTHVLETKTQAYTAQRWHGRSFIQVLGERGYLDDRTSVVHAVWLTDRDIEILAEAGSTVIHCLLSNLRLGDGVARLPALHRAGVPIALGTDGRGCNETLDMLELAKMTALVHKARGLRYEEWPTAAEVFEMATRRGDRCCGHEQRLGAIEPGAHGDLALLDAGAPAFAPLIDPVRQLIYGAPSRHVKSVVVGGEVVLDDGRAVRIDEKEILGRARDFAPPAGPAVGGRELESIVRKVYERAEESNLGLNAYVSTEPSESSPRDLVAARVRR